MLLGSLCTVVLSATVVLGGGVLLPRTSPSPTPCPQRYVCPEPKPYPGVEDTGDDPGPGRFKCRIGRSVSDPNFAFCIYEKVTSDNSCGLALLTVSLFFLIGYGQSGWCNSKRY